MIEEISKLENHIVQQFVYNNLGAIVYANLEGTVLYANPAAEKLYQYEPDELLGKHVDIFNSQETHNTQEIIDAIISTGGWSGEIIQAKKSGQSFTASLSVFMIYDKDKNPIGYASNSRDISERIAGELQLQKTLTEKEILLSEIHHRLKNNLAIISSILELEKHKIQDDQLRDILINCQNRIKSTALVHELLYQNESLSEIFLKDYIQALVKEISESYGSKKIDIEVSIPKLKIDFERAIHIGLIIAELASNSIKHAFDEKGGRIDIKITTDQDKLLMQISDNGKGLPPEFDIESTTSAGMTLVQTFVQQLEGSFNVKSKNPTTFELEFNIKP